MRRFRADVESHSYPGDAECYHLPNGLRASLDEILRGQRLDPRQRVVELSREGTAFPRPECWLFPQAEKLAEQRVTRARYCEIVGRFDRAGP